eukprot:gnl/MRDRNA2_/MRDRNA2_83231_c0_seq2.p1 gnl/MRDRNA2_/MRDRNA2_83231_c0~~gnl/MRDRNA2_/MRDRNA2_83231_c0_seq2.p1  ORF type:complete len:395 (-),score=71.45 gnl/MRDRNA2_/MRDRNA2_83231_c0_seq2:73-1257(-)
MGRKKKLQEQGGSETVLIVPCRRCQTTLEGVSADAAYVCDYCSRDIPQESAFFCCPSCDFSLCGNCHDKKHEEAKQEAERNARFAQYIVPEGQIHPEVWAFCEEYEIQDKLVKQLNEEMTMHHETWEADMEQLYREMRHAKGNRNGLLCMILKSMRNGTFLGAHPPDPKIAKIIKEYRLDRDAREKLTNFLQKRDRAGEDWEKDLWETEQRLMSAQNPSKMALTMVLCIGQGKPLPPVKHVKKDAGKEYDRRHGRDRDRGRSRSRSRRRERYSSRSRERGRGDDRDRVPNRPQVSSQEMAEIEEFCKATYGNYKKTRRVEPSNAPVHTGAPTELRGGWAGANMAGARIRDEDWGESIEKPEPPPPPINAFQIGLNTKAVPKFGAWQIGPSTIAK